VAPDSIDPTTFYLSVDSKVPNAKTRFEVASLNGYTGALQDLSMSTAGHICEYRI